MVALAAAAVVALAAAAVVALAAAAVVALAAAAVAVPVVAVAAVPAAATKSQAFSCASLRLSLLIVGRAVLYCAWPVKVLSLDEPGCRTYMSLGRTCNPVAVP